MGAPRSIVPVESARYVLVMERVSWLQWPERLESLMATHGLTPDSTGTRLVGDGLTITPPALRPLRGQDVPDYLASLHAPLGLSCLLLMQAGATAIAVWADDDMIDHKVIRKYVVRGRGRAQTSYLKTKGKSRFGSRLRLKNAEAQLVETNERLIRCVGEDTEQIFFSSPVRMWPELFATDPGPPFERDDPRLVKVPFDVKIPSFAELKRIRWLLGAATIVSSLPTTTSA